MKLKNAHQSPLISNTARLANAARYHIFWWELSFNVCDWYMVQERFGGLMAKEAT